VGTATCDRGVAHIAIFLRHGRQKRKNQLLMLVLKWTATVSGWTWHKTIAGFGPPIKLPVWCLTNTGRKPLQPLVKHHLLIPWKSDSVHGTDL